MKYFTSILKLNCNNDKRNTLLYLWKNQWWRDHFHTWVTSVHSFHTPSNEILVRLWGNTSPITAVCRIYAGIKAWLCNHIHCFTGHKTSDILLTARSRFRSLLNETGYGSNVSACLQPLVYNHVPPTSRPRYRRQVVNPRQQTPQGQSVAKPGTLL